MLDGTTVENKGKLILNKNSLSTRMNGHRSSSNSPDNLPLRLNSIPNLTIFLLIHVGMYMYTITYPLILIASPATILYSPLNLFCLLDTALVLTSEDFRSTSPLFLSCTHSGGFFLNLSGGTVFTVCSHTFTLF